MAYRYDNTPGNDRDEMKSWTPVIVCLGIFFLTGGAAFPLLPIGLIMLFNRLNGRDGRSRKARRDAQKQADWAAQPGAYHYTYNNGVQTGQGPSAPGMQGVGAQGRSAKATAPGMQGVDARPRDSKGRFVPQGKVIDVNKGRGLVIGGAILASIFGLGALSILGELLVTFDFSVLFSGLFACLGFMGGGLAMVYAGRQQQKKMKRYRKYLALIGRRDSISIASLAQAMPVSVRTACEDLQDMLDQGMIPRGYLDMGSGRLVLNEDGLKEEAPAPQPAPEPEKAQDDDAILREIRAVNDAIPDKVMSEKIDRIEEITRKILDYQKKNPAKAGELRSFLNYYLPTTLKILNAYAQMDAQGIQGENISSAKARIEGMMDKVVEGFEKQLDKLFADSAMDITTDVEVLERMLEKDGLSGGQGMTLGL